MARYWFKPRDYGYGATPVTREGWALALGTAALISAMTVALVSSHRSDAAVVAPYLVVVLALVTVVVIVSKRKTDGVWRWRWGRRQN